MTNKNFNRAALIVANNRKKIHYVLAKRIFEIPANVIGESEAQRRQLIATKAAHNHDLASLQLSLKDTNIDPHAFMAYVNNNIGSNDYLRIVDQDSCVVDWREWMIDFIAFPNSDYLFFEKEGIA